MRCVISVTPTGETMFRVTVEEGGSQTVHDVTVTPDDVARYAPEASAPQLVKSSFEFLLEREPKEAILGRFALPVIERYFPEYPRKIRQLLAASQS
jgi:hypothetical protein